MTKTAYFRMLALISISITLVANAGVATAQSDNNRGKNPNLENFSQSTFENKREFSRNDSMPKRNEERSHASSSEASDDHESDSCLEDDSRSEDQSSRSNEPTLYSQLHDDDCAPYSDTLTPVEIGKRIPVTLGTPVVAACAANATISWTAAISPGYARVDNYRIQYSSDNGLNWIAFETQTSATNIQITGLTSGLTYIFRVAAHNKNGWGLWSGASVGCTTIISGTVPTYGFSLDGLTTVPAPDTNVPVVGVLPIVFLAYQSDVGPEFRTVGSVVADSGVMLKGTYTYDLYIVLPPRSTPYTFSATGAGYSLNSLGLVGTVGSGHPADIATLAALPGYASYQTYAFTITSGTNIAIVINP